MATFTGTACDDAPRATQQDPSSRDRAGARGPVGRDYNHAPGGWRQVRSRRCRVALWLPALLLASGLLPSTPEEAWSAGPTVGPAAHDPATAQATSPALSARGAAPSERSLDGSDVDAADDKDGIGEADDACPSTPAGRQVDAAGCAVTQLCPCRPDGEAWKDHTAYLACVAQTAKAFIDLGLIATPEQDAILSRAERSRCGKRS